jgi:uncharacterized protein YbgA (DUF1722 family)
VKTEDLAKLIAEASDKQLMDLILGLAAWLTLEGRSTYEPGTTQVLEAPTLRRINELMHRLIAAARHLNDGERQTAMSMLKAYAPGENRPISDPLCNAWKNVLPRWQARTVAK